MAGQVAQKQNSKGQGSHWITRYKGYQVYYKIWVQECGLDSYDPEQGLLGFCKHGNEPLNFIIDREFSI
jgi:hypothetical protein